MSDSTGSNYGDTFTFGCQAASSMVRGGSSKYNNATVTCLLTGQWDLGDLSCPDVRCNDPGQPKHGKQETSDYRDGKTTTFSCYHNLDLFPAGTSMTCSVSAAGVTSYNNQLPECRDSTNPVLSCSNEISVPPYASLLNYAPSITYSDNIGLKRITIAPGYPGGIMSESEISFTYSATDFYDNSAQCTVKFVPTDQNAPTFTCLSVYTNTWNLGSANQCLDAPLIDLKDDVDTVDQLNIDKKSKFTSLLSSSSFSNVYPPLYEDVITVTVTDTSGNSASCKYPCNIEVPLCHKLSFLQPPNGEWVQLAQIFTLACNSGYSIYDETKGPNIICNSPSDITASRELRCASIDGRYEAYHKLTGRFTYNIDTPQPIPAGCDYLSAIQSQLVNDAILFNAEACRIAYNVTAHDFNLNSDTQVIVVDITVFYEKVLNGDYITCVALHEVILKLADNYPFSILQVQPAGCPRFSFSSSVIQPEKHYCIHPSEQLVPRGNTAFCYPCPEGTYRGQTSCLPCPIGEYNDLVDQTKCTPCGASSSTKQQGALDKKECLAFCPPGLFSSDGLPPCRSCPENTYWFNATYCAPCNPDTATAGQGAQTSVECLPKCVPGYYSPTGFGRSGTTCQECPRHFYQSQSGSTSCVKCPADSFTLNTASKNEQDCLNFRDHSNQANCAGTCTNGNCVNLLPHVQACVCNDGYFGPNCETRIADSCASLPCLHGANCNIRNDLPAGYECDCPDFTSGDNCETLRKTCTQSTCQNFGMCEDRPTGPKCHCLPGSTGNNCEIKTDLCSTNPCDNGGTCVNHGNIRTSCQCTPGWEGELCKKSFDDCYADPCRNFGTCKDGHQSYTCDCSTAPGYSGTHCEIRNNPCAGVNCGNGICVPNYVSLTSHCVCNSGSVLSSDVCVSQSFCSSNPCQNGMQCVGGKCRCSLPFYGSLCQHRDRCRAGLHQCRNNGKCINKADGTSSCECPWTHEGNFCDVEKDACKEAGCYLPGTESCVPNSATETFSCNCNNGYTGKTCQTDINECRVAPCLHNGTCSQPTVGDYNCNCPPGWTGKDCMDIFNPCHSMPCQSGSTCHNLFGNYYCECLPNSYGDLCENKIDVCDITKPCVKGTCKEDGAGGVECNCPSDRIGDRCEIIRDPCNHGVCQNGGTCIREQQNGYSCKCALGYEGRHCEVRIDHCSPNDCPPTATCINMVERRYCRCPIEFTGFYCNKSIDLNFDVFFNGNGMAYIPYPVTLKTSKFSVSLWVQYKEPHDGKIFTLTYLSQANFLNNVQAFAMLDSKGFNIKINGSWKTVRHLQRYDDGFWHYLVVQVDGEAGKMTIIMDTVQSDPVNFDAGTSFDYNMVPFIGASPTSIGDPRKSSSDNFQGMISNLHIYGTTLNFRDVSSTGNEDVTAVFSGAIILIPEYFRDSTTIIRPSRAGRNNCRFGYINYPSCDRMKPGKKRVEVSTSCPPDEFVIQAGRLQQVSWIMPQFRGHTVIESTVESGHTFAWGWHQNIIEARNDDGNAAVCTMWIKVNEENCTLPEMPSPNGKQTTQDQVVYNTCNDGHSTSIPSPALFTCGSDFYYNPLEPYLPFRIPPCGATSISRINVHIEILYEVPTIECKAAVIGLTRAMNLSLTDINQDFEICLTTECSEAKVNMSCSNDIAGKTVLKGFIYLSNLPRNLKSRNGAVSADASEIFHSLLGATDDNPFDYTAIVFAAFPKTYELDVDDYCPPPLSSHISGYCTECGPGTYYNNSTRMCHFCPLGTFTNESNQYSCIDCNSLGAQDKLTTEQVGAYRASECKKECGQGTFFNGTECQLCPLGFYQHEIGRFFCYPCSVDTTTRDVGTKSKAGCANLCPPGKEIGAGSDSGCQYCIVGFYRVDEPTCQKCPAKYVTKNVGAFTVSQCDVVDNPPGTERNADGSNYTECDIGYYQEMKHQWSCNACDPSYTTLAKKSVSKNDCLLFCAPGNVSMGDECVPCGIGFYKAGEDPQSVCQSCPGNFVTRNKGASSTSDCTLYKCFQGQQPNSTNNGCESCPVGEYQSKDFMPKCEKCDPGTTTRGTGSKLKKDCLRISNYGPWGEWEACSVTCGMGTRERRRDCENPNPSDGDVICLGPSTNSSSCSGKPCFCEHGKYKNSTFDCVPCPMGTYKNTTLQVPCTDCPDSKFTTNATGAKEADECRVLVCDVGTYGNYTTNTCKDCAKGFYQDMENQSECKQCDNQFYTRKTKSTSKQDCEAFCDSGKQLVNGTCVLCERGYYKDNTIDRFMECKSCNPDKITPSSGSISESDCSVPNCTAGYFINGTQCSLCPIQQYQDEKWQTSCKPCGTNKVASKPGATSSNQCFLSCPEGQENLPGTDTCQDCDIGYYKDVAGTSLCKACDDVNVNGINITSFKGAKDARNCTKFVCLKGYEPVGGKCVACGYGKYQPDNWKDNCESCTGGTSTFTTGAISSSQCITDCPEGEGYDMASKTCKNCPIGYYRDKSNPTMSSCTLCENGLLTPEEKANSNSLCTIVNCTEPGTYRDAATNQCKNCSIGEYQNIPRSRSCQSCDNGKTTRYEMSGSPDDCKLDCAAGRYLNEDVTPAVCTPCAIGFFRTKATWDCEKCGTDLTTVTTGSTVCSASTCTAGKTYRNSMEKCMDCPVNEYQNQANTIESCIPCGNGKYTDGTGKQSSNDCKLACPMGQEYIPAENKCQSCAVGYYRDNANTSDQVCKLCENGLLTPSQGAISNSLCTIVNCTEPGTYRDAATNQCKNCSIGEYQNIPRSTSCQSCDNGKTTRYEKSGSPDDCKLDCLAGFYLDESVNPAVCKRCSVGSYRTKATWTCQDCPTDLSTSGEGSTSSSDCSVSTCVRGSTFRTAQSQCVVCPKNEYQDVANTRDTCKSCNVGLNRFTDSTGKTSVTDCQTACQVDNTCNATELCVDETNGHRCDCKPNHDRNQNGACVHRCDTNYCGDKGTCQREPFKCNCIRAYYGDRCETRRDAESLSNQSDREIVVGSITGIGLLLILILIIVACCVFRQRRNRSKKYSDRGSISNHSDIPQFGGMKPSQTLFAPQNSMYNPYGNKLGFDNSVYTA